MSPQGDPSVGALPGRCQRCAARLAGAASPCAGLPAPDLGVLSGVAEPVAVASGATLFGQGDPVSAAYVVSAGTVRVKSVLADGRAHVAAFASPGGTVALHAAIAAAGGEHSHGAEAIGDVRACRVAARPLLGAMERSPALRRRLAALAAAEMEAAHARMLLLGRKTAVERLATFLGDAVRLGATREPSGLLRLPMSRTDIVDHLGLTLETVCRTFTRLRGAGVLVLHGPNLVEVKDADALAALSEGA